MSSTAGRQSGREKLAAMKAAQVRQQRQRRLLAAVAALVVVVIAVVVVMWVVASRGRAANDANAKQQAAQAGFIGKVTSVPASVYDQVGAGTASNPPAPLPGSAPMTQDGKPRVLYVGAEFCPYCAMERWSLVAALSRFGTFTGLKGAVSSSQEGALSNIQTMTFLDAHYTSRYLTFDSYETTNREHHPLQSLSKSDEAIFAKYDPEGSIPFVDWGGQATSGVGYDGSFLVGMSNTQIANALSDPSSRAAQGILGSANVESAQVCRLTNGQPAKVCNSPGVKAAAAKLPS